MSPWRRRGANTCHMVNTTGQPLRNTWQRTLKEGRGGLKSQNNGLFKTACQQNTENLSILFAGDRRGVQRIKQGERENRLAVLTSESENWRKKTGSWGMLWRRFIRTYDVGNSLKVMRRRFIRTNLRSSVKLMRKRFIRTNLLQWQQCETNKEVNTNKLTIVVAV